MVYLLLDSPHSGIMDAYSSPFSYGEVMLSPQSLCTLWQLFTNEGWAALFLHLGNLDRDVTSQKMG